MKLNDHQAAFFRVPDDWQPRVVDLDLWVGEEVRLAIWGAWLEHSPQSLMIALPRLVVWHGPYYEGSGGLGSPGPHRMSIMPSREHFAGRSDHLREIGVAPEVMTGPPLLMARVDCVRPATLHLESEAQEYQAVLNRGYHWLPLRLGNPPKALLQNVDGVMERGHLTSFPISPWAMKNGSGSLKRNILHRPRLNEAAAESKPSPRHCNACVAASS